MNGAEHYREAERTIANAKRHITEDPRDMRIAEVTALVGIGEALLAVAAATAMPTVHRMCGDSNRVTDWGHAIGWDTTDRARCNAGQFDPDGVHRCLGEPNHDRPHYFEEVPF